MRGEREMFERACWKIFVLQVHVSTRGVRSFFFFLARDGLGEGRGGKGGCSYKTSCCWLSWIDLIPARISASSGGRPV